MSSDLVKLTADEEDAIEREASLLVRPALVREGVLVTILCASLVLVAWLTGLLALFPEITVTVLLAVVVPLYGFWWSRHQERQSKRFKRLEDAALEKKQAAVLPSPMAQPTHDTTTTPSLPSISVADISPTTPAEPQVILSAAKSTNPLNFTIDALGEPLRLLFLAANPTDTPYLRLTEEFEAVRDALDKRLGNGNYILAHEWNTEPSKLGEILLRHRPHILHFAGHGTSDGELLGMASVDGAGVPYPKELLTGLLAKFVPHLQIILINTCWSEGQAKDFVANGKISVVIGMREAIGDTAARAFADGFYYTLAAGETVQTAFDIARYKLPFTNTDANVAQILTQQGLNPAATESDLTQALATYLADIELDYLKEIEAYVDLMGDQQSLNVQPLNARAMINEAELWLKQVQLEGTYSYRQQPPVPVNARTKLRELERAVLLGDPGTGKTWTLWKLLQQYVNEASPESTECHIPVRVPLNTYKGSEPFEALVRREARQLEPHLATLIAQKRIVFLFDALNEMPIALIEDVKRYLQDKPFFIVSCREDDYKQYLNNLPQLKQVTLRYLTPPQIKELIQGYLRKAKLDEKLWQEIGGNQELLDCWERLKEHHDEGQFWQAHQQKPEYLDYDHYWAWRRVWNDDGQFMMLCRKPFEAGLLCKIYEDAQQLPKNHALLFASFVAILIKREEDRAAKRNDTFPKTEDLEKAVEQIATTLQAAHTTVLPREAVLAAIQSDEREPLLRAALNTTILEEANDEEKSVKFSHQLLQEYFAARTLRDVLQANGDPAPFFEAGWWDPGIWRVALTMLGELPLLDKRGRYIADVKRVVRWLAPYSPAIAFQIFQKNEAGRTLQELGQEERALLLKGATDHEIEEHPYGRAAAYRVLGLLNADNRRGVGLRADGLPDIVWCKVEGGDFLYQEGETRTLPTFYIAKFPITMWQYEAFIRDGGYNENARWWRDLPFSEVSRREQSFPYGNHPRENVTWWECVAFTRWLNAKMRERAGTVLAQDKLDAVEREVWQGAFDKNLTICLPREEEWEKAARGTDGREYPWGAGYQSGYANIDETWTGGGAEKQGDFYLQQTSAVGIYANNVSPYGIMDMAGNVWEWTATAYKQEIAAQESQNPSTLHKTNRAARVLRGGSWYINHLLARAAVRDGYYPYDWRWFYGVRVCASSAPIHSDL